MSTVDANDRVPPLKALVVEAFNKARVDGKPGWDRMTLGVLKNRILQITSGTFDERNYGGRRFIELIRGLSDLVAVDETSVPPTVEFLEKPIPEAHRDRLRRDLWQAVMDYSSGTQYVWDPSGEARPRNPDDPADLPTIPTMSAEEMAALRSAFADRVLANPVNAAVADRVREWAERGYRTAYLPQHLRSAWNEELTHAAVTRVRAWFQSRRIAEPAALVIGEDVTEAAGTAPESADALRSFILRAVEAMTPAELRRLELPAGAALRAQRKRG